VGSTCAIYSESSNDDISIENKRCIYDRNARRHSYDGKEPVDPPELNDTWKKFEHARGKVFKQLGKNYVPIEMVKILLC